MRVKMFRSWFLMPAILAALSTAVSAADLSDSAMQDEIRALKKMVLDLQKRVRELEAVGAKPEEPGASTTVETAEPRQEKAIPARISEPKIKAAVKTRPEDVQPKPGKRIPFRASHPKVKSPVKSAPETEKQALADSGTKAPAPLEIGGHKVRVGISGTVQADVIHDFNAWV